MRLTITDKPRFQQGGLLTTTAIMCLLTATGSVAALQNDKDKQDVPVIKVVKVTNEAAEEVVTTTNAAAPATTAAVALQADTDTYPAAFFDQYSPQNAFDMIQRLPGFSFDPGSNVRGFGGAAGNVLIDGARPTSKSGGLQATLRRIPAAQVERIEILRGGISGGEAAGQSTVANVIRKQTGSSGTWTFTMRRAPDGNFAPNLEAAISSKIGEWDTSFDIDIGGWVGYRTALIEDRDANSALEASSDEIFDAENEWLSMSGEGSRSFAGGKLTLNGRANGNNWSGDTIRENFTGRLPDASVDDSWTLGERTENREAELGIDWTRTYTNKWKWRLIGLALGKSRKYSFDFVSEDFLTDDSSTSRYVQDRTQSEFILRTTYGLTSGKFKPEFGVEGARNQMDSEIDYVENGVTLELDAANVTVQEYRAEAFATANYQVTENLSLDGGITFEASQIKVSGDASNKQTVKFWKPRLSATYSFSDDIQLTLEGEKQVGQLNFNLFAASTDAADDRATGGNAELRPDKKWRVAATFDWKFSERGSFKATSFYQWRSDILEEIVLPSGSVGRGNAGDATFYGIEMEASIPTDGILKGGLLELGYNHRRSNFEDPILGGMSRPISWYTPDWFRAEFRQDITSAKFSWGLQYYGTFTDTGFLVDQRQEFNGNGRFQAFVETTRFWGLKMRLQVQNLNTGSFTRTRYFFSENRGGNFEGTETSFRKRKPEFRLEVSGTF